MARTNIAYCESGSDLNTCNNEAPCSVPAKASDALKSLISAVPTSLQNSQQLIFKIILDESYAKHLMRIARAECYHIDGDRGYGRAQDWCDMALDLALKKTEYAKKDEILTLNTIQKNYRIATGFLFALTARSSRDCQRVTDRTFGFAETMISAEGLDPELHRISIKNGKEFVRQRVCMDSLANYLDDDGCEDSSLLPSALAVETKEELLVYRADMLALIEAGCLSAEDLAFIQMATEGEVNIDAKNSKKTTARIAEIKVKAGEFAARKKEFKPALPVADESLAPLGVVRAQIAKAEAAKPAPVQESLFTTDEIQVAEVAKSAKAVKTEPDKIETAVKAARAKIVASQLDLFDSFESILTTISDAPIPSAVFNLHLIDGRGDPPVYYDCSSGGGSSGRLLSQSSSRPRPVFKQMFGRGVRINERYGYS